MRREDIGFESYFRRQIELWGIDTQRSLCDKRVAVIGCGGLGSAVCAALGGSGIGELMLVDFDEISPHNLHRQILYKLRDVGLKKADTAARDIQNRDPFIKVVSYNEDFKRFTSEAQKPDLIIDATDNLPVRSEIDRFASEIGVPWIYGSVEGYDGQVCFFDKASFDVFATGDKKPGPTVSPMVMQVASLQANLALRYLAGMKVAKDMLYYLYYDGNGEFATKRFAMPT